MFAASEDGLGVAYQVNVEFVATTERSEAFATCERSEAFACIYLVLIVSLPMVMLTIQTCQQAAGSPPQPFSTISLLFTPPHAIK